MLHWVRLAASPVDASERGLCMGCILKLTVTVNGCYCIMIVLHLLREVL